MEDFEKQTQDISTDEVKDEISVPKQDCAENSAETAEVKSEVAAAETPAENAQPAESGETPAAENDAVAENTSPTQQAENSVTENADPLEKPFSEEPELKPFEYTKPEKTEPKKAGRGVKIFALVLALTVALTAACTTGYFFGRNSVFPSASKHTAAELAARPKNTDELTEAQVYEKINKSVVGIYVYNQNGDYSYASGVVYSKDGYIVTNDHIYSDIGAPKFKIYTFDGTELEAEYVAGDTISDLAVLKVKSGASDLSPAEFGNSADLFCGEHVVAVGRTADAINKSSITSGIISLTSRRVKVTSSYTSNLIQTDSAINPGSSGGALSNMYGQVIGITSSKLAGAQYDAVGFAIPTVTMKRVAEQLIKYGKVTDRAKLGITYTNVDSVTAEINNYASTGLYVVSVSNDSDIYGKVKEGDIITYINGVKITGDNIVLDIIEQSKAGDTVTLTVLSSGSEKDYSVKLMANSGESSYSDVITSKSEENSDNSQDNSSGGNDKSDNSSAFSFPFGE